MDFFYKEKKREREIVRMYLARWREGEVARGLEVKGSRGKGVLRSRGREVLRCLQSFYFNSFFISDADFPVNPPTDIFYLTETQLR